MSPADTPAVARRRVRIALRGAREAKGLTQGQIAEAMEWSLSKVMRIEKGDVNISPADLRVLLSYLDVTDPVKVKTLMDDARTARSERWSAGSQYKEHLTPALLQMIQFEQEATEIRAYGNILIPGILQTAPYAEAVVRILGEGMSEEAIRTRIEHRLRRRDQVLYRDDPPDYLAILDESVLFRRVGGPAVMAEQLLEIVQIMEETPILVRVVPFAEAATIALLGPFSLLTLGSAKDELLYRENNYSDEIIHSERMTKRHRDTFEQLWARALSDERSAELIRDRAADMIKAAENSQ
jgi:transcriptional regulator with XRE-family HTH domain